MSDQIKTAKQRAEELLAGLFKGQEVHEIFSVTMRNQLLISGETIDHWEEKFKIKIPMDDLTPAMCKKLDMDIMQLHQEAAFHHAVAATKQQLIKRGAESKFMDRFAQLVQDYKSKKMKLPAAATLERLAQIENDELESAQAIADMEAKFWKNILDHLSTCRKIIENASLNISVELKALNGGLK